MDELTQFNLDDFNTLTYFSIPDQENENVSIDSDSLITISKFNMNKATSNQRNVLKKNNEPFINCPISLFGGLVDSETILMYSLTDGKSHINSVALWKLKNKSYSGTILRIYQGSGRTLRFRNKHTNKYSDINISYTNICVNIPKNTMSLYTIEFPKRKKITESTVVLFNFMIEEKKEPTDCVFDNVDLTKHDECYICYEKFKSNESVFYPHDKTHPICTECAFRLTEEKCPMCRKKFVLFD